MVRYFWGSVELVKFAVIWDTNSKKTVVSALTIHNKKKWHDSKSRASRRPRGGHKGNRGGVQSQ